MKPVRSIMIALLSGAVAGLVIGGAGGRVAMRIVADSIHRFPELTIATLTVLLIGTILGTAGGLIFSIVRRFLPSSLLTQGSAFTATIFALASGPLFLRPPGPDDELALNPGLGRALFSVLLVAYGLAVPVIARALDRYLPVDERYRTPMTIVSLALGIPGLVAIGAMITALFAE